MATNTANFTQLPEVTYSNFGDIIAAVQGNDTVQESLQQVFDLFLANTILNYSGNPNGNLGGDVYQLCWDKTNNLMYVCTTAGGISTAVWTLSGSVSLPVSPSEGGTGVASPTAHSLPIAEGASDFNFILLSDGQILIGDTGSDPVATNISAGPGITVINGPGSIQISGTASSIGWNVITGTSAIMVADNGYITNNAGLVTLTLPLTAAVGTQISVVGKGIGGWTIAQNAGQSIVINNATTTVGVGGSVSSNYYRDNVTLICTVADLEFQIVSMISPAITYV